jgi:hypothetical protein
MNKIITFCCCLFFINILFANADDENYDNEYILDSIDYRFIGAYLSVDFITTLERTKNYDSSMSINSIGMYEDFFEVIIVYENKIIPQSYLGEGFWGVSKSIFLEYIFEYINENEIYIIDHNGHKYKKLTDDVMNYKSILNNFIASIIFIELIHINEIKIENGIISIISINKKFKICTFGYVYNNYNRNENLILMDCETDRLVYFVINNNVYSLYWMTDSSNTPHPIFNGLLWKKIVEAKTST